MASSSSFFCSLYSSSYDRHKIEYLLDKLAKSVVKCVVKTAFDVCFWFLRILLIHFLHTANSMQTALTGNGKGRIILPYSRTVKCHCSRERDSSLPKLR